MKPQRPYSKSSNFLTKAIRPRSQFSSSKLAHEASAAWFSRALLLGKDHRATNPGQLRKSNPRGAVKKKKKKKRRNKGKNNEVKNGVFIDSNVTYIPGSKPDVKRKQAKLYKGVQTSEGEERERASVGVFGSPEQSAEKDPSASSSLGISKLRSKPG